MGLVKIRISGDKPDLDVIMRFICDTEAVMKFPELLSTSIDYPNRDGSGYRRYLDLMIESGEVVQQEATLEHPELPPNH